MIPEAAVEAVSVALETPVHLFSNQKEWIRHILEAAAPHTLAEAWDVGYGYGRNGDFTNPYRPAK